MSVQEIIKPDPDGHFRLLVCSCKKSNVVYIKTIKPGRGTEWVAGCLTCARYTRAWPVQHYAQIEWNGRECPRWDIE